MTGAQATPPTRVLILEADPGGCHGAPDGPPLK